MANSDFIISKDKPEVTHIPTGMVWEFRMTPEGYWDVWAVSIKSYPILPADQLARVSRQAGEELQKEWKL